jgi:dipeptidyl aminopeptidase/acylaminoacyl peptidase
MLSALQPDNRLPWQARFRAPTLYQPQLAKSNPARGLVISNQASEAFQIYAWDVAGGDLRQLTDRPDGTWEGWIAPDGRYVYFLDDRSGDEHGHVVRIPFEGGPAQDLTPEMQPYTLRGFEISRAGNLVAFNPVNADGYQLVCIELAPDGTPGEPRRIYQSRWETWESILSAQGEFAAMKSSERAGGARRYSTIVLDTANREQVGELWDGPDHSVEPVAFSPVAGDFRLLATTTRTGFNRPLIWNPHTGERHDLELDELAGELLPVEWSPGGQQILLWHLHRAAEQLYLYDLTQRRLLRLQHPDGSFGVFKASAFFGPEGEIWAGIEDAAQPPRLIALDGATGAFKRNVLAVADLPEGRPFQSVTFASSDEQMVQGWLGLPAGAGPFPTILAMHGGPHLVQTSSFDPFAQAWLDHGFAFLTINYRGSTTFGRPFQEQIWGNLGHWELEDMVAARNWLVEQGIARADAVLLNGGSYGGYLTLWGLGRRPDLWAGGMALVPVTDMLSDYEDASEALKGAMRAWMGGSPEEKRDQYIASSPITHAEQVRAPVLIIQGRHDTRVPPRQVELYEAKLKALGKPIRVIWYEAGHGTGSVELSIQFMEEMLKFAREILRDKKAG